MMGLDFATGVAAMWLALILSIVHVLTSPKREWWPHLPAYIRAPLPLAALAALFRGVELITLALNPALIEPVGHASPLAFLMVFGVNTIANGALVFILCRTYPPEVWNRIRLIRSILEGTPRTAEEQSAVDLLMTTSPANLYVNGVYVVPAGLEKWGRRHGS